MEFTVDNIFKTMILSNCAKSLEAGFVMLSSFDNKEIDYAVNKYLGDIPKLLKMDWRDVLKLQTLDLRRSQIAALPKEIGNLNGLQTLDLGGSQITELPKEIGNLNGLQTLYLWGSQITELPKEIGNLKGLQTLDLRRSQITELPKEIGNLKGLQTLYLYGTKISKSEIDKLRKKLPNCEILK